jgi:hypothetical protein
MFGFLRMSTPRRSMRLQSCPACAGQWADL